MPLVTVFPPAPAGALACRQCRGCRSAVRSALPYTFGKEKPTWTPGAVYAAGGFVAVERLAAHPDPAAGEEAYYFTAQTVLLAGT